MLAVMTSISHDKFEIIAGKLQGRGHLPISQRPTTMQVVQIVLPVLQENPKRFMFGFAL